MICNVCGEEKWETVFSSTNHSFMNDLKYLDGMCFDCYETVPKHIPVQQMRKFLERKTERWDKNNTMKK
jgi:hypothetical protein